MNKPLPGSVPDRSVVRVPRSAADGEEGRAVRRLELPRRPGGRQGAILI